MGQSSSTEQAELAVSESKVKSDIDERLKVRFHEIASVREPVESVDRSTFGELLSAPLAEDFGQRLFEHEKHGMQSVDEDTYVTAMRHALGHSAHSDPHQIGGGSFFFQLFCDRENEMSIKVLRNMVTDACVLALSSACVPYEDESSKAAIASIQKAIVQGIIHHCKIAYIDDDDTTVTNDQFASWVASHCPDFFSGVMKWVELQCLSHKEDMVDETTWTVLHAVPQLDTSALSSDGKTLLQTPFLWALVSSAPSKYRKADDWTLLYNSSAHGLGANRFKHHCYQYRGPTIVIIKDSKGRLFGVCVDSEWRDSGVLGGEYCRLFTLSPTFKMIDKEIQFEDNCRGRKPDVGFGFGPNPKKKSESLMWLDPDMERGTSKVFPSLSPGCEDEFRVMSIEVWGCGDPTAIQQQKADKRRDKLHAEQRQKVKRAEMWGDGVDRTLLGLAKVDRDQARVDTAEERKGHTGVSDPST